ncbi:MAG: TonB-dependent receptor, partial [Saprospiraceae bacterium]|nr:TonB-dependent receptor [Saprospiraceae bacterium]
MRIFFTGIALMLTFALNAQFYIKGSVTESSTQSALDYATVIVLDVDSNSNLTGTTTADGGSFNIEVPHKNVYLEISFVGFNTTVINDIKFEQDLADLGNIVLNENSQELDEIVLTAERSTTEFK